MAIDGHRSTFPTTVDNWGNAFTDNICEVMTAARFNTIEDALFALESHTHHLFVSGLPSVLTPAVSGSLRPKLLFKTYVVGATGSAVSTYTFSLSGFTTQEKSLFNGTPLASGNLIQVQIRKAGGDAYSQTAYHCAVLGPITDDSGDSGWRVVAANSRHGNGQVTIGPGTFVVSVMVTS